MIGSIAKRFLAAQRPCFKNMQPLVQAINAREDDLAGRDDDSLRAMLAEIRERSPPVPIRMTIYVMYLRWYARQQNAHLVNAILMSN